MLRNLSVVTLFTLLGLWSIAAAEPATRPSTSGTRYESKAAKLAFYAPASWKRQKTTAPDDQVFSFDLTPPAKAKTSPVKTRIYLALGEPCERQKTLANVVADTRKGIAAKVPGVTFTEDAATKVAGLDAWTLVYTATSTGSRVEVRNGVKKETPIEFKEWRRTTIWLQNDTICQINLSTEPANTASMEKLGANLVKTFEWN